MTEQELRQQICDIGSALYQRDLVGGAEGNITARIDDAHVIATPAGAIKGWLDPKELAVVSLDGEPKGDIRPSSEIELHLRVYRELPDIQAVVHAHPIAATAFAASGRTLPRNMLVEADFILGEVPLVPFAIPGSPTMGDNIAPFLGNHRAFLLQAHGAVTIGEDLRHAFVLMETLERCSRILLEAAVLGGAKPLPPETVRWLEEF